MKELTNEELLSIHETLEDFIKFLEGSKEGEE